MESNKLCQSFHLINLYPAAQIYLYLIIFLSPILVYLVICKHTNSFPHYPIPSNFIIIILFLFLYLLYNLKYIFLLIMENSSKYKLSYFIIINLKLLKYVNQLLSSIYNYLKLLNYTNHPAYAFI